MNEAMKEACADMMQAGAAATGPNLAKGAIMATTGYMVSKGLGGLLLRNPWVAIGLGLVAGYMVHKYEKEIVAAVVKTAGMGKDFVMQQKETLADLVEEAKEAEEQQAKP